VTDQTKPGVTHRIAERFRLLRAAGKRALIPYAVAGHPTHDATLAIMQAMVKGGGRYH